MAAMLADVMTTATVADSLNCSRAQVILLSNIGILPHRRIQNVRIFTPKDIQTLRRRLHAVKQSGRTIAEWREAEVVSSK